MTWRLNEPGHGQLPSYRSCLPGINLEGWKHTQIVLAGGDIITVDELFVWKFNFKLMFMYDIIRTSSKSQGNIIVYLANAK